MKPIGQLARALIYLGFFSIPFDNLRFSPSAGWATISPYIFLAATPFIVLSNPKLIKIATPRILLSRCIFIILIAASSLLSYFLYETYWELIVLTVFKLALGIAAYLNVLYVLTQNDHPASTRPVGKSVMLALISGYSIALIAGIFQLSSKLGIGINLPFDAIFLRFYQDKVQFTFTEPSFASLHVIGVIIPVFFIFHSRYKIESRRLLLIGISILTISILSGSSLRALIDSILLAILLFAVLPYKKKLKIAFYAIIGSALFFAINPANITSRLQDVLAFERSNDPSSTIRKFRSQAAIFGTLQSPYSTIFGYGFGNSGGAMDAGFNQAMMVTPNTLVEIEELANEQDGLTYSLHVKILAEHGIVGYIFFLVVLFSRRYKIFLSAVILTYIQFDSYAFYALWIYLAARCLNVGTDQNIFIMPQKFFRLTLSSVNTK